MTPGRKSHDRLGGEVKQQRAKTSVFVLLSTMRWFVKGLLWWADKTIKLILVWLKRAAWALEVERGIATGWGGASWLAVNTVVVLILLSRVTSYLFPFRRTLQWCLDFQPHRGRKVQTTKTQIRVTVTRLSHSYFSPLQAKCQGEWRLMSHLSVWDRLPQYWQGLLFTSRASHISAVTPSVSQVLYCRGTTGDLHHAVKKRNGQ